jgi:hypothetical protein
MIENLHYSARRIRMQVFFVKEIITGSKRGHLQRDKLVDIKDRNSYSIPRNQRVLSDKIHHYLF